MTIRKTASITPQRGLGIAAITAMAVSLTGCGMISSVIGRGQGAGLVHHTGGEGRHWHEGSR
eukprot:gene28803-35728_t